MSEKETKKLCVNYGNQVVVLPGAVTSALSGAKKTDIIVLINLLSDTNAQISELAEKCSVSEDAVEKAIAFWRGAGILCFEQNLTQAKEEKNEEAPKKEGCPQKASPTPSINR